MSTLESDLLREIEDYIATREMAASTFGRLAVNDGKLVDSLRNGSTVTLRTVAKIRTYIAAHPAPTEVA